MNFLALLNLEDVAACMPGSGLPPRGLLLFFLDWVGFKWGESGDEESCRVIHLDGDGAMLKEIPVPEGLPEEATARKVRELVPWRGLSIRNMTLDRAGSDDAEVDDWINDTSEAGVLWEPQPAYQIGGWPVNLHSDVHVKCAKLDLAARGTDVSNIDDDDRLVREAAAPWRLLFQIDSGHSGPEFYWADGCALHFMIREEDLRTGRFDRVLPSL